MGIGKIAGVCVAIGGAILLLSGLGSSQITGGESSEQSAEAINTLLKTVDSFVNVNKHVRNLPNGYHASQGKRDSAKQYGIVLNDNQTWVDSYQKEYRKH